MIDTWSLADRKGDVVDIEKSDEEVRWVPGLEGEYAVSKGGTVYSFKRGEISELNGWEDSDGYHCVKLSKNRTKRICFVHRLVLWAFESSPPTQDHECRHLDGNKKNNHIDNLKWGTHLENMQDFGENNPNNKISKQNIVQIRRLYKNEEGVSQKEIAKRFNVSIRHISRILRGERWSNKGGPIKGEDYE